jgi:hypothetical protein
MNRLRTKNAKQRENYSSATAAELSRPFVYFVGQKNLRRGALPTISGFPAFGLRHSFVIRHSDFVII